MFVAGCCKIAILAGIRTWVPHKIEEKKTFTPRGFDPRTFRMQKKYSATTMCLNLRRQILIASEMIFPLEKPFYLSDLEFLSFFHKSLVEYEKFLYICFPIYVYYLKIIAEVC